MTEMVPGIPVDQFPTLVVAEFILSDFSFENSTTVTATNLFMH